jgi:hypothetical protein
MARKRLPTTFFEDQDDRRGMRVGGFRLTRTKMVAATGAALLAISMVGLIVAASGGDETSPASPGGSPTPETPSPPPTARPTLTQQPRVSVAADGVTSASATAQQQAAEREGALQADLVRAGGAQDLTGAERLRSPFRVATRLSDRFGAPRGDGFLHAGVDIVTPGGATVAYVPCSGTVLAIGPQEGFGDAVIIQCVNGWRVVLGQLDTVSVALREVVTAGQTPAGKPGPYLHLEVRQNGLPLDPEKLINFANPAADDATPTPEPGGSVTPTPTGPAGTSPPPPDAPGETKTPEPTSTVAPTNTPAPKPTNTPTVTPTPKPKPPTPTPTRKAGAR